jgi:uncharacterized membrane protein HdeD (DUF308 family)
MALVQDAYIIAASERTSDVGPALAGVASRAGIAMLFGLLALMIPGIAIAALLLLSGVYLMAAALLAITAVVTTQREPAAWDRIVRDDVADLAHGNPTIWPMMAVIACVVVLGA